MAKPEIRLKGFEGEWEDVCFRDITYLAGTKNRDNLPLPSYSITNENGFVPQNEQFENGGTMANADKRMYYIVTPDTFAYNPARINVGSIGYDDLDKDVIVSSLYVIFKTDCKTNNYFLDKWFKTPHFKKLINLYQEGGVRLYFFYDKLCQCHLFRPELKEQQSIANYFKSLDSMIQGVTKKIASLKQMKQACLVSMFPEEGETTPRVRFKGFKGEWNKDKAGNLFMTFNERNRPDLPVLSANQDIRGMAPRTDTGYNISHNKANEVTYKVVKPGQYVIHLRSFQGGFAHSAVEGITSPAYTVFGFKDSQRHDDYFWKIIFMSKEFIKSLETITYGIRDGRSISFSEFAEMNFLFPSKDEQQQIASFFRSLDSQISLQEQRLEKLKQIKSACLDKMFV
ncbi:MAG: restriction endonuclease subunit S [Prevotella sp.]|nr:restriction endonuclease subunit S [Prevotella sp.]